MATMATAVTRCMTANTAFSAPPRGKVNGPPKERSKIMAAMIWNRGNGRFTNRPNIASSTAAAKAGTILAASS